MPRKKKGIKDRSAQARKESMEKERQESEELQRKRALARGPPSPKRKGGRKKLNLTEGEREARLKQQKKAAYERRKQKVKGLIPGEVGDDGAAEGSSGERDWKKQQLVMAEEGGDSLVMYEEGGPKKRRKVEQLEEKSDTESSLANW